MATNRPPGLIYTEADLDAVVRTMLGEAANQGDDGLAAVAHVIRNRLERGNYGGSLYDVAHAPKQFSAWNSGEMGGNSLVNMSSDSKAYQTARTIAEQVLNGQRQDNTDGAVNYFAPAGMTGKNGTVKGDPAWTDDMSYTTTIGGHKFYSDGSAAAAAEALARGSNVRSVQQQLASNGFSPGAIDGVRGPKTDAAIRAFQKANGLVVDGIVGPKTQAALNAAGSRSGPASMGSRSAGAMSMTPTLAWPDSENSTVRRAIPTENFEAARQTASQPRTVTDPVIAALLQPKAQRPAQQPSPAQRNAIAAVPLRATPAPSMAQTRSEQDLVRAALMAKPVNAAPKVAAAAPVPRARPIVAPAPAPVVVPKAQPVPATGGGFNLGSMLQQGTDFLGQKAQQVGETLASTAQQAGNAAISTGQKVGSKLMPELVKAALLTKPGRTVLIDGGLARIMNGGTRQPVPAGKPAGFGSKGPSVEGKALASIFRKKKK